MTPDQFLNEVAVINARELHQAPDDIRLACNAIMATDAFFGVYWAHNNPGTKGDDAFKERIASVSQCYRVVRDAAYAIKHGELTSSKIRLVRVPSSLRREDFLLYDDTILYDDDIMSDQVVIVQAPGIRLRAFRIVDRSIAAACALLAGNPVSPDTLTDGL